MQRYAKQFDGTIPVTVALYDEERIVATQEGVGLYDGNQKSLDRQLGTVHVTTHRLIYVDASRPESCSIVISLSSVNQTEFYTGFLKSSSKVTLYLANSDSETDGDVESWICHICSYRNPPGLGDSARKCGLCGVTREVSSLSLESRSKDTVYSGNISVTLSSSASAVSRPTHEPTPCPACTFLNHPSLHSCEICATPLEPQVARMLKSAPASRPQSPSVSSERESIKISFRKGGDKAFYAALKRTLVGKPWEAKGKTSSSNHGIDSTTASKSGIHGIFQHAEENAKATNDTLRSALGDLEALMIRTKEMVELASSLNAKLTAQEEQRARLKALQPDAITGSLVADEPEEAKFIRSSLSQLGLQTTAVTSDMVKDEKEWIEQLARELGAVLTGTKNEGLMRNRGIVGLDEIWGGWNRARGVALIPPETMLLCLPHLPTVTNPPIRLRTFRSGLRVLHTPHYTLSSFTDRLLALISASGPQSTTDIAQQENITGALTSEMVESVEEAGDIIRDEQGAGSEVRWWHNSLRDYTWDGS
ncbi:EAP30/Vps36 family-domain-containing protein [Hysterangium stoloniferum]|nr:EAP30/Vps36 family-domain-containing protein [Hysterangium stoloniferum]